MTEGAPAEILRGSGGGGNEKETRMKNAFDASPTEGKMGADRKWEKGGGGGGGGDKSVWSSSSQQSQSSGYASNGTPTPSVFIRIGVFFGGGFITA